MFKVDLNCDLGESFGNYEIGMDEAILPYVTSVNIACGWHAGDPIVIDRTIALAKAHGVAIGAHPGFLDLMGFGRRNMAITREEARHYTTYQLGAFSAFAKGHDMPIQHVKPHGALYNMAAQDKELARGICEAIYQFSPDIMLLALAGSQMIEAAKEIGIRVASEVFADRAYENNGSLVPRTQQGAVIHDTDRVIERVLQMIKKGKVNSIHGHEIAIVCDSICVHGDNIKAVEFVQTIHQRLKEESISLTPFNA